MKAALCRGNAVCRVQSRGTPDRNHFHRTMRQKGIEIRVWFSALLAAEFLHLICVCSVNRGDFNAGNRTSGTRVRLRDVSSADQSDVNGHGRHHSRGSSTAYDFEIPNTGF
jgi:hypothetical protein